MEYRIECADCGEETEVTTLTDAEPQVCPICGCGNADIEPIFVDE